MSASLNNTGQTVNATIAVGRGRTFRIVGHAGGELVNVDVHTDADVMCSELTANEARHLRDSLTDFLTDREAAGAEVLRFVERIAQGAAVILRAHPGCGAVAALALALQNAPVPVPAVDERRHDEDAKVEAYAEVRRLTAEVAELRARLAAREQGALFESAEVGRG